MNVIRKTVQLPDGREIIIETGKLAKQADGAVMVTLGKTMLLATVCSAQEAPMGLTRALLPLLKQSPDASVIFVGESHGETPKAYWGGFGASKAALNYLCKVAADEWERFENLRANVLVPGPINSPQRIKSHPGESKSERKNYEDVLPQFVWWASEENRGRSGEIVYL